MHHFLGYHFPEHDSDKILEPIRTGYAYIFYNTYHKNFHPTEKHIELCRDAQKLHHEHAKHHIQHYENVFDIPDIHVYEIVSDWASANFEQRNIIKDKDAISLQEWFNSNMSKLPWTEHQLEIIENAFQIFAKATDEDKVKAIWQPLLELADLSHCF